MVGSTRHSGFHESAQPFAAPADGSQDSAFVRLRRSRLAAMRLARSENGDVLLPRIDPQDFPVDPRLIARLGGAAQCLRWNLVPLARRGSEVLVATADPAGWPLYKAAITDALGPVRLCRASREAVQTAIAAACEGELRIRAETRVLASLSARRRPTRRQSRIIGAVVLGVGLSTILLPQVVLVRLLGWVILALTASTLLRGAALLHAVRVPPPRAPAGASPMPTRAPLVSILVPLYDEPDIAARLVARLERLHYPRHRLEVMLILEAGDHATRTALTACDLPPWMRLIIVPPGQVQTKPRAMNYALDFCQGEIIGIYDAEDAPDPDQLRQVVRHFAARGPEVACLQGALDYYNSRTNLIARLFTAEYAAWFRIVMPALQWLHLPMPLGGTTVFLRRAALEQVGAWDAHNVTEDADLGVRLARHGLRTEMLASTTHEEANCRPRPWLAQRSRWIKGHLLTWAVHMRNPAQLWRDLGGRGFLGYQVVFLGAQSQVLLTPVMWSFWLLLFGGPHPIRAFLPPVAVAAVLALLTAAGLLMLATAALGLTRTRHRGLWPALVVMPFYHLMAMVAGWRAVWEACCNPFYWAKTSHGHFDEHNDGRVKSGPVSSQPVMETSAQRVQRRLHQPPGLDDPAPICTGLLSEMVNQGSTTADHTPNAPTTTEPERVVADTAGSGPDNTDQPVRNSPASILSRVSNAREI